MTSKCDKFQLMLEVCKQDCNSTNFLAALGSSVNVFGMDKEAIERVLVSIKLGLE